MFESIKKGYRDLVSKLTEPHESSKFYEKGILTTEEYVRACDWLIQVNPIWKWGKANNEKGEN